MITYPNPKINLGLHVTERRPDGYHNIETLFLPYTALCDVLEIVEAAEPKMFQYGLKYDGRPEENLCFKAWELLHAEFGIPAVAIHLYKKIPVGAGLGGGSSDAAFTLKMVNDLFSLDLSDEILAGYAARLGSDCPFFIYNRPMFATGRGEILSEFDIDLSEYEIELVTPSVHVSTKDAYAGIAPSLPEYDLRRVLSSSAEGWKGVLKNDFEKSVFAKYPELAELKNQLYERGATYASMSGSGSALYGLFRKNL